MVAVLESGLLDGFRAMRHLLKPTGEDVRKGWRMRADMPTGTGGLPGERIQIRNAIFQLKNMITRPV
jgi:hypothetical protein